MDRTAAFLVLHCLMVLTKIRPAESCMSQNPAAGSYLPPEFASNLPNGVPDAVKSLIDRNVVSLTHSTLASIVYDELRKRLPDRKVFVLVYDPVGGWDKHAFIYCNGLVYFRAHRLKNIVAAVGSRISDLGIDETTASNLQSQASVDQFSGFSNKEPWINEMANRYLDCKSVSLIGGVARSSIFSAMKTSKVGKKLSLDHVLVSDSVVVAFG